jgi:hypothetical protein
MGRLQLAYLAVPQRNRVHFALRFPELAISPLLTEHVRDEVEQEVRKRLPRLVEVHPVTDRHKTLSAHLGRNDGFSGALPSFYLLPGARARKYRVSQPNSSGMYCDLAELIDIGQQAGSLQQLARRNSATFDTARGITLRAEGHRYRCMT